ncbi:XrtA/PEP-CTERM system TPR-repeat protein PrsT [Aliagarivorans taiwanensis]|uniref:XrtA/PEP-CTERM system TPR-repeat protein PrsT n=1 Tax=Aliagarivorans taiwanensis TaxID=561966 RepID=UPI000413FEC3|nr:XrtA/PEP-CTERM system TPR-repeat protein PrsT [Aliagarivorans taiwanensis]
MKRITRTLALGLIVGAFITGCSDSVESHQQKAVSYLAENNPAAAIIELKNAAKKEPENPAVRYQLGQVYLGQGDYANAEKELGRALSLAPEEGLYLVGLALNYLASGQYSEIEILLQQYPAAGSGQDGPLLGLQTLAYLQNNQLDEAKFTLQQAKQLAPDDRYVRLASASIDGIDQNHEQAEQTFQSLLASDADDPELWLIRAHYLGAQGKLEAASEAYQKASRLRPLDIQRHLYLAQSLVREQKYPEAEPTVDRILRVAPNHPMTNILKAQIRYQGEDYQSAYNHARTALDTGLTHWPTRLIAGASAFRMGQYERALPELQKLVAVQPDSQSARRLLVATQLRLGQLDQAVASLDDFDITDSQDSQFMALMGTELSKLGHNEAGEALLERSTELGDARSELRLTLLKIQNGDSDAFAKLQQQAQEQPSELAVQFAYAYALTQRGDFQTSLEVSEQTLTTSPNYQPLVLLQANAYQKLGQLDKAQQSYQQLLDANPEDLAAKLGLYALQSEQGDSDQAFADVYALKQQNPDNLVVARTLLGLAVKAEKLPDYIALVEQQMAEQPDSASLQEQAALGYIQNRDDDKAIALFESIPANLRTNNHWLRLGDLHLRNQQLEQAREVYAQWLNTTPLSLQAHLRNLLLMNMEQRFDEGLSLIAETERQFTNNPRIPLIKAQLLQGKGDFDGAIKALGALSEQRQAHPAVLQRKGLIYFEQRDWENAEQAFIDTFNQRPNLQSARYYVASLLNQQRRQDAITFLQNSLNQFGDEAAALRYQLAELEIKENPGSAIANYKKLLEQRPDDVVALNNLAWAYEQAGDITQALSYAETAYQQQSEHPAIIDTYGYMLLKNGDANRAVELLTQAAAQSEDVEIHLHLAEALIAAEQTEQASQHLGGLEPQQEALKQLKQELLERLSQ